ncbi:DUF4116 domain-containing protein [Legionella fairfieldensis]|uniref:DUF4116 domain-containing protein n=1 Tax=Legionella fairfieldensis TaxID=45064 RepID=UPI00048F0D7C|nr:DUF4116 domain-containing protein [Legionella fairfieldensis]
MALAALADNGWLLEHASGELKADVGVVFTALKEDGEALKFVAPELVENPIIQLFAQRKLGYHTALNLTQFTLSSTEPEKVAPIKEQATRVLNNTLAIKAFVDEMNNIDVLNRPVEQSTGKFYRIS